MRQVYSAAYNDGLTAVRHAVEVHAYQAELILYGEGRRELSRWSYAGMRPAEDQYGPAELRLLHADHPDARLLVDDAELQQLIADRSSSYAGRVDRHPVGRRIALALLALIVVTVAMFVLVPRAAGPLARLVPASWEARLGERVVQSVLRDDAPCASRAGTESLERLRARLLAVMPQHVDVTIRVSDDRRVNALAAPGGHIVIFKGLIDFAESPDEVAAVLAHELAHVQRRHGLEGLIRRLGIRLLLSALLSDAGSFAAMAADAGELLLVLEHSREAEAEADAIAIRAMQQAGISAGAMGRFFQRLQRRHGDDILPPWLSTHPPTDQRARLAAEEADGPPALGEARWTALRNICDDPRQARDDGARLRGERAYKGRKSTLSRTAQSGQDQSSGMSSHFVPGAKPSGSQPSASS